MMFDEADNFLEDDSTAGFSEVSALKSLMQQSERRFKVVFAGLHLVQRFQGIPNQPLAHLGKSICVGPLDAIAARKLVRSPLEVLGFRLDDASVLRILSYTNYHPGLIQLFCSELLNKLYESPIPRTGPPWDIDKSVVETVYYQDLRESIRERFDWTLALDPRYQVIAGSMIVDQMEDHDGYSKSYTANESLRLAQEWWPARFPLDATDEMRVLLEEMRGLGVLARSAQEVGQRFRLRSPNLVRLMGTDEDVGYRLLELAGQEFEQREVEPQSLHRWIDSAGLFSPLTVGQEQQLNQPRFGTGLVFASAALGSANLGVAARTLLPSDLQSGQGVTEVMPDDRETPEQVAKWLGKLVTTHRRQSRLIVTRVLGDQHPGAIQSVVDASIAFCEARQDSRGQWLRIILALPADAAWYWLSLPAGLRDDLETRADAATWVKPLDATGVRQRLAHEELICTPDIVAAVAAATGGWPELVSWVVGQAATTDLRTASSRIGTELSDDTSALRASFVDSLGLSLCPYARPLLELLGDLERATDEELLEFHIEESQMPKEETRSAIEFLRRMGLIRHDQDGRLSIDPVVVCALR
jgi:hypothetical protein